jgi:hypothetical protein
MSMQTTPLEQAFTASLNRLATFSDIDARTQPVRKVHALVRYLTRDLGGDLSTAQRALVVRAATLMALCEHSEVLLLTGREVPLGDYLGAANTLKRLLQALGLRRVPRDIEPIDQYLARKYAEEEVKEEEAAS